MIGKGKSETVKQAVRRYGRVRLNDQNITKVSVQQLASNFKVPQESVRVALRELAAEQGSGWHGSGNSYEYRLDERRAARKPNDTHVAEKVLEFLRASEPGSLQPVRTIAAAIGGRSSSVSSALGMLTQDRWLHLVKVRRGVYSYRPPSWQNGQAELATTQDVRTLPAPDLLDQLADEGEREDREQAEYQTAEREDRERVQRAMLAARPEAPPSVPPSLFSTTPAPLHFSSVPVQPMPPPITGLTPSALRDLERARLGDEERQAAREQWAHPAGHYEPEDPGPGTDYLPDGQYRQLTVTSTGTVLVEDAKGAVYELLPLRRPV